jgi:hypothetical protein
MFFVARPVDIPFADCIDNTDLFTKNRCGITHGLFDVGWNLAGVGDSVRYSASELFISKEIFTIIFQVHCQFFAANKFSPGTDLRSLDYQVGREMGEPNYGDILRKYHGINKCNEDITKRDLIKHLPSVRDMLAKRFKDNPAEIGFTLATDFEEKEGQILGPTVSRIIADQLKRTICGDRFWYSNGLVFRSGKISINRTKLNSKILFSDQVAKIQKITFFKLTCLSLNCNGTRLQNDPFLSPGQSNLKKTCFTPSQILSDLDLKNW